MYIYSVSLSHYPDSYSQCLVIINSTYGLKWFLKYDISVAKILLTTGNKKVVESRPTDHAMMMGLYCFHILASCHTDVLFRHIITAICLNNNAILDYYIYSMFFVKMVQVSGLISSLKTYHPTLHLTPWSLDLFIRVPFQLHGEHTVLQIIRPTR